MSIFKMVAVAFADAARRGGSASADLSRSSRTCARPPWRRRLGVVGRRSVRFLPVLGVACALLGGCRGAAPGANEASDIEPNQLSMFTPLPAAAPLDGLVAEKVNLGRRLYYDTHLSVNNSMSCNSCHDLAKYGVDPGRSVSLGHNRKPGGRNSPTVYNAVLQFAQFWDGRAPTLAAQASGPMMNPVEMGMPGPDAVVAVLRTNRDYRQMFKKAYPEAKDPLTIDNAADAIARFEAGLLTPARWDEYLRGNSQALSAAEKHGLHVYLQAGCASCHAGTGMGGDSYQKLGAAHDWPDQSTDRGRFAVTNQQRDAMYFKVPLLRNVEKTGPWFHNGKVTTLEEAVRLMGEYQTGRKLSQEEIGSIVTFLHALTGPIPQDYMQPPAAQSASATAGERRARNTNGPLEPRSGE